MVVMAVRIPFAMADGGLLWVATNLNVLGVAVRGAPVRWDRVGAVALNTAVWVVVIGLVLSVARCGFEASR